MVYVGIILQWDLEIVQQCVCDVEVVFFSDFYFFFFDVMYGDMLNYWSNELSGLVCLCFIFNVFICMCYCFLNGQLDMYLKEVFEDVLVLLKLWFVIFGLVSNVYSIVFGYWVLLEGCGMLEGIYVLDIGCCWGGEFICLCWEDKQYFIQLLNWQKSFDEGEVVVF